GSQENTSQENGGHENGGHENGGQEDRSEEAHELARDHRPASGRSPSRYRADLPGRPTGPTWTSLGTGSSSANRASSPSVSPHARSRPIRWCRPPPSDSARRLRRPTPPHGRFRSFGSTV